MPAKSSDSQKFLNGLLIGFLAGATSYLLVTTDEGQKLKQDFKKKWQQAKTDLPQLAELKLGDVSLEEILDIVLGEGELRDLGRGEERELLVKKIPKKKKIKTKPEKFRGV